MKTKSCISFLLFLAVCCGSVQAAQYTILAWNDLGMHCYNRDFRDLAVLPPFNNLWAQVIKIGNPPRIITNGIRVTYSFPNNTYSIGKSNFWDYEDKLFGVNLPSNIGLTGKGLSGIMDRKGDHFIAEGIPITEFQDSAPATPYPYQLAKIVVRDSATNTILATQTTVAPVSNEMRCDSCHYDGGVEGISTGRVETNILALHDEDNSEDYPPGHTGLLMQRRPVLCAECHGSNALNAPGAAGIPSLSRAMHKKHADEVPSNTNGCYLCHPGPQTQCLRDVMSTKFNIGCISCHGNMDRVAQNPSPWLNEPRCDSAACHGSKYAQNAALYRVSTGHNGIYCAACHDSPHAIAASREQNDAIKFLALQGRTGTLSNCLACHSSSPMAPGPHGALASGFSISPGALLPLLKD